jgi:hypothetical protein
MLIKIVFSAIFLSSKGNIRYRIFLFCVSLRVHSEISRLFRVAKSSLSYVVKLNRRQTELYFKCLTFPTVLVLPNYATSIVEELLNNKRRSI